MKTHPLNPDFRIAIAGFPLFCLETLFGWPACNLLPGAKYLWGLEESHYHGNIQTASAAALRKNKKSAADF